MSWTMAQRARESESNRPPGARDGAAARAARPLETLPPAARRALEEAAARAAAIDAAAAALPREVGGRKGPEPTRYGDWEKNGIASDF
jgi:hypothetical protein